MQRQGEIELDTLLGVFLCAFLQNHAERVLSQEEAMTFKKVETNEPFNPSKLGDHLIGRVVTIKEKDNGKASFVLVKTHKPVRNEQGELVYDEKIEKRETAQGKGKEPKVEEVSVKVLRVEQAMYRVTDAAVVRAVREELRLDPKGKDDLRHNFMNSPLYIVLVVRGFQPGGNDWPLYDMGFSTIKNDCDVEAAQHGNVYVQQTLRPFVPRAQGGQGQGGRAGTDAGSSGTGGGAVEDDIPF